MRQRRRAGFTMVELTVILAVVGIFVALAAAGSRSWSEKQRLAAAARQVSGAFSYARSEAIRTGNIHAVFLETDAFTVPLSDPIVVLDDGRPGAAGQNCDIDAGEPTVSFDLEPGVSFGNTNASAKVPTDPGGGSHGGTATFLDADNLAATWVMFRPEGHPLAFSNDCSTGAVGSGGGGVYLTNGDRDYAVVVTPLGATRVHSWDQNSGSWTQ